MPAQGENPYVEIGNSKRVYLAPGTPALRVFTSAGVATWTMDRDGVLTDPVDITIPDLGVSDIGVPVFVTVGAANNQLGVSGYYDVTITGTTAGHVYGFGSWINTQTGTVLSAANIIVPFEGGIFAGQAQASARIVFAGQHQAILSGAPSSLHAWRLNVAAAAGAIDALIAAANPGSVGYLANAGTSGGKLGDIPIADIVGTGVVFVRVYSARG